MKKNLLKLHSSFAKIELLSSAMGSIVFFILIGYFGYQWLYFHKNLFILILCIFFELFHIYIYSMSFLCYLDTSESVIIFKKVLLKKEWHIKLEDISNVEKTRWFFISFRRRYIKIIVPNKNDSKYFYIRRSLSSSLLGSDDADYLWKMVLKRKKELRGIRE